MFRIATGIIISLIGIFFLIGGILEKEGSAILGLIITAFGVAILLNNKEDDIEPINTAENKNYD